YLLFFFFQAEDGIRDGHVTGVQTCALPILAMDARYGNQARRSVEQAQQRDPIRFSQDEITKRAQEAVTFARDNATEREAVTDMRSEERRVGKECRYWREGSAWREKDTQCGM